uniref:Uncharacterized protein n=1 Tax=Kryptolebias marmoratus TaxID=37003 RepID=A0A3Q2ZLZ8_KRYMA
ICVSGIKLREQEALVVRYEALREPMAARKQKLSDSLRLQQLFRDVEDEETWIREKEPIASSTNRGDRTEVLCMKTQNSASFEEDLMNFCWVFR